MIERVDRQASPLVEGRFYLVPHVNAKWEDKWGLWPVIGPMHDDKEFFNFTTPHYHVDARFLPRDYSSYSRRNIDTVWAVPLHQITLAGHETPPLPAPVWKRRKCVRTHVDVWIPYHPVHNPLGALRKAFAGQRCAAGKGGWICPHRKASLGSIQPVDGIITCPLHGLRIDAATGRVLENLQS